MKTITGSYFVIGTTHQVCEDYAVHGPNYAIVSDGCSNFGGPRLHTDWGSRFMCKAAEQWLPLLNTGDTQKFLNMVLATAVEHQRAFPNLPIGCITSTLVIATQVKNIIHAYMVGDGVIAGRMKDGTWLVFHYEHPKGAPYYLRYEVSPKDREAYFEAFGSKVALNMHKIGATVESKTEERDIRDFPQGCFHHEIPISDFDMVLIASDGAAQFNQIIKTQTSKHTVSVALPDVLRVLFGVPPNEQLQPGFFESHFDWLFRRNMEGTYVRKDWHNRDDVAIGGIYCEAPD